ncbi:hemerythrin domain-containing protein [Pseudorhodoferax sp. Leaf267]|uniref:hemerythrin domain-containing protein n=1 Tax=Pseudorhodoferax sp. Leaf267 TaxID=1736316 RepID=UPI0006F90BB7|nr:hemerythrin domain-containing protein [Pseudorhodoferax sp. Leaf267]KQP13805.1 hemerythrin [Pseudorhodoferax sp. Leaf267]
MNIFEALRISHQTQRALVDQLVATEGDSRERSVVFTALRKELQAHETAEERCFYVPLIEHDATVDTARHGIAEHHEMDEMVEELADTEMSSPAWLVKARALRHKVHHHLDEEEQVFFQLAGKVLSAAQKTALAKAYEAEFTTQRVQA